jgi:Domain of unknown function (DUF4845)
MRNRQRGVTFIGWVFLLAPLALVVYCAIRLTPIYLNYMSIAKAVDQTAKETDAGSVNPAAIRVSIDKRLDVEGVTGFTAADVKVEREGEGWVIIAGYEDVVPVVANVSLLVQFDKRVKL